MVKVNESKPEDQLEHSPQSFLSIDDSFVVLERSPSQELNDQFASHMLQQPPVYSAVSPRSSYTGGLSRLEGQTSQNSSYIPDVTTDLSPEEIQKRLHELLQENLELKETLQQNNLAMKQQFHTLAMWQEEVFKVHQNHKAKFAETKELVLKLRAENTELKNILEESRKTGSGIPNASETKLMMENVELVGKIAELQQRLSTPVPRKEQLHSGPPSKKEQELSALLEQVNRQLETAERSRRQLTVEVEHLTAQRTRLERDMAAQKNVMEEQKEQLQKSQKEKEELEQKITLLMEQYQEELSLKDHQQLVSSSPISGQQSNTQEIQRLTLQRDDQLALIDSLTHELKTERAKVAAGTAAVEETPAAINEQASLARDLRDCEETLGHINSCLDKESERFSSLDSWLQVASDSMNHWKVNQSVDVKTVNALKAEIQELRNLLIQEKASNEEKKKNLEEAQEKFRKLYSDYEMVVKELQNFHEEQKDKDRHNNAYFEVQARGFTEKIDSMTAQLLNMEEALAQKEKEVAQMKETVEKCELEKEAVTILKAQVEVYQSDFNAEREARENLAGEKERLAEDLRHLQRRNQQLLDELEAYQQNQYEQMQKHAPPATVASAPIITSGWNTIATPGRAEPQRPTRSSPGRRPSPGPQQQNPLLPAEEDSQPFRVYDEEVPPPKRFFCPVCNMAFAQVSLLEYHVETCLE